MTVVAAMVLSSCGGGNDSGSEQLQKVALGVGIRTPTAQQTMETYLPLALGYWEAEGLDVTIQGFDGSGSAIQALVSGKLDVVNSTGTNTIAAANLAGSPLQCFAVGVTSGYMRVVRMPKSDDINGVEDFSGHKIGVFSLESSQTNWTYAAVRDAGLDPKDAEFIAVGAGPEAAQALKSGQIDVLVGNDSATLLAEDLVGAVRVPAPYFDKLGFNTCMAAESSSLSGDDREVYVGLARGYMKAVVFAEENPEAAVKLFWEAYPEGRPTGDRDAALKSAVEMLKVRFGSMQPLGDLWGSVSDETVKAQIDALVSGGAIEAAVDVDTVWTDDLIDDINDFDVEAIRSEARNWKEKE